MTTLAPNQRLLTLCVGPKLYAHILLLGVESLRIPHGTQRWVSAYGNYENDLQVFA